MERFQDVRHFKSQFQLNCLDTPFDWYNARFSIDFKVFFLANVGNIAIADHNGIVNGSYSFLKHFDIKLNGKKI